MFEVSYGPKAVISREGGAGRSSMYPWAQLEAPTTGDDGAPLYSQFFVPGKTTKRFSGVAQAAAKRHHISLAVRAMSEDGVEGVLVQRVEARPPRAKAAKVAKAGA